MPVPLVGMVEFSVGKENDVAELGGTPEPPGWDAPLPVGNEKDIAPELGGSRSAGLGSRVSSRERERRLRRAGRAGPNGLSCGVIRREGEGRREPEL